MIKVIIIKCFCDRTRYIAFLVGIALALVGIATHMGTPSLSLGHGFRCATEATVTVGDVLITVGEKVGYENVAYALRRQF